MSVLRVSGDLGSGKTTICKMLSEFLGYKYSYTGGIFRELAKERGLSIEEFYKKIEENPELEKSIDNRQAELMSKTDNLIVEGRMAPFLPCPFRTINIFIAVDALEGAKRQLKRPGNEEMTLQEIARLSRERIENERKRYKNLYGIQNHLSLKCFDIKLDTTYLTAQEAFDELLYKLSAIKI